MSEVMWERYPRLAESDLGRRWLTMQANLGLAPNTIDAYGRALEDYLNFSQRQAADVVGATRDHIAAYVRDLASRPNRRGANVVVLDSGAGLANATLQQRLTAARLFYDYLIEEGLRPNNPVGRGRYTPGKGFGGTRERGLVPRFTRLPWIRTMSSGARRSRQRGMSFCGTVSCWRYPTTQRCGERNFAPWTPVISIPPIPLSRSGPRTPSFAGGESCPIPPLLASRSPLTWPCAAI